MCEQVMLSGEALLLSFSCNGTYPSLQGANSLQFPRKPSAANVLIEGQRAILIIYVRFDTSLQYTDMPIFARTWEDMILRLDLGISLCRIRALWADNVSRDDIYA